MKVWVYRNYRPEHQDKHYVFMSKMKPGFELIGMVPKPKSKVRICLSVDEFKSLYGFIPKKGSCKQMNLTLTEIE